MRAHYPGFLQLCLGVCALCALVAYAHQHVNSRLGMTQTHLSFVSAVQASTNSETLAHVSQPPQTSQQWATVLQAQLPSSLTAAPSGGPTYVLTDGGNPATGAVGITSVDYGNKLVISRPAYAGLIPQAVTVSPGEAGS